MGTLGKIIAGSTLIAGVYFANEMGFLDPAKRAFAGKPEIGVYEPGTKRFDETKTDFASLTDSAKYELMHNWLDSTSQNNRAKVLRGVSIYFVPDSNASIGDRIIGSTYKLTQDALITRDSIGEAFSRPTPRVPATGSVPPSLVPNGVAAVPPGYQLVPIAPSPAYAPPRP